MARIAIALLSLCSILYLFPVRGACTELRLNNEVRINPKILKINIPFIENRGQVDEQVLYYAQVFNGTVYVTQDGRIVYSLLMTNHCQDKKRLVIAEQLMGTTISRISGVYQTETLISCFTGNDSASWHNNISNYEVVNFHEVYKDIDIKLKAYGKNVEKLFYLNPGANPDDIKIKMTGIDILQINTSGELEAITEKGVVTFTKPIAYQEFDNHNEYIDVGYKINGYEYSFQVGNYDPGKTLVIDPLLASTFIGGSGTDDSYEPAIAFDDRGNVYLSGYTSSTDFPTTIGVFNDTYSGGSRDRFVTKFDSKLEKLLASTFIGGSGEEVGMGLGIDKNGHVFLAGYTNSSDFPTTTGAYDETHNGGRDVYISKLDENLATLLTSTFLGGSNNEGQTWPRIDLTISGNGIVYVAGLTRSTNFPITANAYDSNFNGGLNGGDPFIAKFDSDLRSLLASTFLGGSQDEWRVSVVVNGNEDVFICGETESPDFPTTPGAYDRSFNGWSDIFIVKLDSDLTAASMSMVFGGSNAEEALAMKLDAMKDHVCISGYTKSTNFPTTGGAYNRSWGGGDRDGYIAIFDDSLKTLLGSTFLGGNGRDDCRDLAIDLNGNIYVAGNTTSSNFPTTPGAYDESINGGSPHGDVIISKFNSDLTQLIASTFLGGSGDDVCFCLSLDENSNVYIGGFTNSSNFPVTVGSYDSTYNGGSNDCFIAKLDGELSSNSTSVKEIKQKPTGFLLYNNYPNPFNPETTIHFDLAHHAELSIKIFNLQGELVRLLINRQYFKPGSHRLTWNGRDDDARGVCSGEYLCKIEIAGASISNKMLLIK